MKYLLGFSLLFLFAFQPDKGREKLLYDNYVKAFKHPIGTYEYYVVINVKNLNSGEKRELCTGHKFIIAAMREEYGWVDTNKLFNKQRHLEFKKPTALYDIGFNYASKEFYTIQELNDFEKTEEYKNYETKLTKESSTVYIENEKSLLMTAHILFNKGIRTGGSDCWGGNLYLVKQDE